MITYASSFTICKESPQKSSTQSPAVIEGAIENVTATNVSPIAPLQAKTRSSAAIANLQAILHESNVPQQIFQHRAISPTQSIRSVDTSSGSLVAEQRDSGRQSPLRQETFEAAEAYRPVHSPAIEGKRSSISPLRSHTSLKSTKQTEQLAILSNSPSSLREPENQKFALKTELRNAREEAKRFKTKSVQLQQQLDDMRLELHAAHQECKRYQKYSEDKSVDIYKLEQSKYDLFFGV